MKQLRVCSTSMMEGSGSLEQQLEATKRKAAEVRARRSDLKKIEDLGAILEEHLILDNRYTEHSTVGLAQQWDQLDQLGMRMQHNLEQQIQARNQSGRYFTCFFFLSIANRQFIARRCQRGRAQRVLDDVQALRQGEVRQAEPPRV